MSITAEQEYLINLYRAGKFEELAKQNLKMPIDADDNTIIHYLCCQLDRRALEAIKDANPGALTYDVVNMPNKFSDLPIHRALETLKKSGKTDHSFIAYLIDILGCNPRIPNAHGHIIVKTDDKSHTEEVASCKEKVKELNEHVIKNIIALTNIADKFKADPLAFMENPEDSSAENKTIAFLKKLTEKYAVRLGELALAQSNLPVRDKVSAQTGGKKRAKSKSKFSGQRKIRSYFPSYSNHSNVIDEDDDDITENGHDSFVTNRRNYLLDGFGQYHASRVNRDAESDSDSDDQLSRPRKKREETESDKLYKDFLEMIKKALKLGDGEEADKEARLYRSGLKITIVKENPELKGKVNDKAKIEKMREIIEDATELKKKIKSIDWDEIKKIMAEMSKQGEERKKQRPPRESRERREPKTDTESEEKKETKPKRTRKSTKTEESGTRHRGPQLTNDGYIKSDELLFSTEEKTAKQNHRRR